MESVAEGQADARGQVHFEVPSGLSGMAHLKERAFRSSLG